MRGWSHIWRCLSTSCVWGGKAVGTWWDGCQIFVWLSRRLRGNTLVMVTVVIGGLCTTAHPEQKEQTKPLIPRFDRVRRPQVLWKCRWQNERTMGVTSQCFDLFQPEWVVPGFGSMSPARCRCSYVCVGQGIHFLWQEKSSAFQVCSFWCGHSRFVGLQWMALTFDATWRLFFAVHALHGAPRTSLLLLSYHRRMRMILEALGLCVECGRVSHSWIMCVVGHCYGGLGRSMDGGGGWRWWMVCMRDKAGW